MKELFNNKENDILKFKINSEGIDTDNVESRLVLITKENKNILLIGEIENGVCKFNIPELSLYEKGDHGKIKFEIISEDLYFPVWEDNFEIKSKVSVKIEEMVSNIQNESIVKKPKISVMEPINESKPEKKEKPIDDPYKKIKEMEQMFEKALPIIEEDENGEIIERPIEHIKPKEPVKSVMRFDKFK